MIITPIRKAIPQITTRSGFGVSLAKLSGFALINPYGGVREIGNSKNYEKTIRREKIIKID